MQWKDQIAYRCPLGLKPPGVMNCVCVCVYYYYYYYYCIKFSKYLQRMGYPTLTKCFMFQIEGLFINNADSIELFQ